MGVSKEEDIRRFKINFKSRFSCTQALIDEVAVAINGMLTFGELNNGQGIGQKKKNPSLEKKAISDGSLKKEG